MEKFYLEEHLSSAVREREYEFSELCAQIHDLFCADLQDEKQDITAALQIQKRAIIGYEKEVAYFKDKIRTYLKTLSAKATKFPSHYETLADAVYHENWGLAGLAQWFSGEFCQSSSAKIIGERIYFLIDGKMVLMEQRISAQRREQLVRALLLLTPEERMDQDFHEVYMLDGTRITVFTGNMVKKEQDTVIFRRYIIPEYTFQTQADRHTIPQSCIRLFEYMIKIGYNVVFTGAVRSAKSTFLSTWQCCENPQLEGVLIETDPEIPLHKLMPKAPIVQVLVSDKTMPLIAKNLLRSDADYFIFAEARDGSALDTAVKLASKGTKRMKMTFHLREPAEFCEAAAAEIVKACGGDSRAEEMKIARSFDYILHFIQLADKSQKRLKGIYAVHVDEDGRRPKIVPICEYDHDDDSWRYSYHMDERKRRTGTEEDNGAFCEFDRYLRMLAGKGMSDGDTKTNS